MKPSDPWKALLAAHRIVFVHAHPDDETLTTGALIAALTAHGVECGVVTATRGEQGEIVPGSVAGANRADIAAIRADELARALSTLGVSRAATLGEPPARLDGARTVAYRDSGMRWLDEAESVAGAAADAPPDALTRMPVADQVADLAATLRRWRPDVVVSYDIAGTYGHPDHVRTHHVACEAARACGMPFIEVVSPGEEAASDVSVALPDQLPALLYALTQYRTQLTVIGEVTSASGAVGVRVQHVGGQTADVWSETVLRWGRPAGPVR